MCIYHVLQSHTHLGGFLLDSLQFLTLQGTKQDTALQVQSYGCQAEGKYHFLWPTDYILANKNLLVAGVIASTAHPCLMSRLLSTRAPRLQTCCVARQSTTYTVGWDYSTPGRFCICLPLLYMTGRGFSEDFLLNVHIFFSLNSPRISLN